MYEPPRQPPPAVPQSPDWGYQAAPFVVAPPEDAAPSPETASPGRRALAWGIDFALVVLLAVGLGYLTYKRMVSPLSGVSSEVASGARKLISSGFDFAGVAAKTGPAVWGAISGLIVQGFIALVVIQFLYQFIALSWTGRTIGKALIDLRVVPAAGAEKARPGKGRAARRAAVTALTDSGMFSIACCLLVTGWFVMSVLLWLLAVAAFWANALPSLAKRRQSLADLAAGTVVTDAGQYRALAKGVARGSQVAAARIAAEARGLAEHERVKQVWESQRAQQLREGAAARSRQAWESQPAQQLRQAGQGAAAKGKQAWESERAQQLREGAAAKGKQAWSRLRKTTGQTQPVAGTLGTGNPITAGNFAQPPGGPAVVPPPLGQPGLPPQLPAAYPPLTPPAGQPVPSLPAAGQPVPTASLTGQPVPPLPPPGNPVPAAGQPMPPAPLTGHPVPAAGQPIPPVGYPPPAPPAMPSVPVPPAMPTAPGPAAAPSPYAAPDYEPEAAAEPPFEPPAR